MARLILAALALMIWVVAPVGVVAQEEHGAGHTAESLEHDDAEGHIENGHGEEHHHKNHFAVFVGATQAEKHDGEREDPQFTLGLDYERRLTDVIGVGVLLDVVVEGHREGILAIPMFLHTGDVVFQVAAGVERVRDGGDTTAIGRLGALYDFDFGKTTLSPGVFYDFTEEGGTWVFGVNIGWGF